MSHFLRQCRGTCKICAESHRIQSYGKTESLRRRRRTYQPRARQHGSHECCRRAGKGVKKIRQPYQRETGGDYGIFCCFALKGPRSVTPSLSRTELRSYRCCVMPRAEILRFLRGQKTVSALWSGAVQSEKPFFLPAHGGHGERVSSCATRRCMQHFVQRDFDSVCTAPCHF